MSITKSTICNTPAGKAIKDDTVIGLELYIGKTRQTWRVYYRTHNKTERRYKIGYYPTISLKDARSIAKRVLLRVAAGEDPAQKHDEPTMGDVFNELIDEISGKRKPKTVREYRSIWKNYLERPFGSKPIGSLSRAELDALHQRAPRYIGNRVLALVSRLYSFAASRDYVHGTCNPARGIERFPERARTRYARSDELARIGRGLVGWRRSDDTSKRQFASIIALIILTGSRSQEIASARPEWIDFETGALVLPDSKRGQKAIALSDAAISIIAEHCAEGKEYIFQREDGNWNNDKMRWAWQQFKEENNISNLQIKDLRRTTATYASSSGVDIRSVQKQLDHKSVTTTETFYAFMLDKGKVNTARRISKEMERRLNSNHEDQVAGL